jgi:foldase protein PrsA
MLQNEKTYTKKGLMYTFSIVLTISLLTGYSNESNAKPTGKATTDNNKAVVTYEGGQITQNDWDKTTLINSIVQPYTGNKLIAQKSAIEPEHIANLYLYNKAPDNIKKEAHELAKKQLDETKKMIGTEKLKKSLESYGLNEKDILEKYKKGITASKYFDTKVTEKDRKVSFEELKDQMFFARFHYISIRKYPKKDGTLRTQEESKKIAEDIHDRLKKGEDFAKVAEEVSNDRENGIKGGLYKHILDSSSSIPSKLMETVRTIPVNQTSDIVKEESDGEAIYYLVYVNDRKDKTFDKMTKEEKDYVNMRASAKLYMKFVEEELNKVIKNKDQKAIDTKLQDLQKKDELEREKQNKERGISSVPNYETEIR